MSAGHSDARTPSGGKGHLAVIDMQRVFADPASPWATPRYADAAAGVRALLPAFAGRVTFTRFLAPERPAGAWRAYYDQWPFARRPPDAELWALTDEFAGLAEHVMDAPTFGKWTPELAARTGPDGRLVLAGVSTDCCVLSTALAAADAGAEVLVVADACAGVDDDSHVKALQIMELYRPLVRVTTIDDLLAEAAP
ncbi:MULTISPECIES: cysteine hydrolase family protein [Streptomyces]|uniref:Isochorismatase family protein n=1 Tax=Streptomyces flaveolus TaxID=67297 RepID=A0ABV3A9H0_9ACTN|nr:MULTISPECIES: isochorismatase family protein [Streptomyces]KMS88217.1 hydrolase [Streptomyces regensis]KOG74123.1 hydrolase [Streptomyces antibioticus]